MPHDKQTPSVVKRHILGGLILLKAQALASLTSFVVYAVAFLFLEKNAIGLTIYSIFSMLASFLFVYSDAFKLAKNDLKSYHNYEHYPLKGLVMGLVPMVIVGLFLLLWQLFYLSPLHNAVTKNEIVNTLFIVVQSIFVGYSFPFRAFMGFSGNHVNLGAYFLIFLWPLMSGTVGYIAGLKDFPLYQKLILPLIYKKKNPDKK